MSNIAIVGYGHVGKAIARTFEDRHKIYPYTPSNPMSEKMINDECDIAFVCVPTEPKEDGSCDTSIVEEAVGWLDVPLIIIKSTVPPGTTLHLMTEHRDKSIVFSPEYYGESKYYIPSEMDDPNEWPYHIFGGLPEDTSKCVDLFMDVFGPTKQYYQTNWRTAEMVKYMENVFFATKVTFCQEMYNICKKLNIDYNEAREMWVGDPRINPMHTAVFPDKRGYSGKCFPKDVKALIRFAEEVGYDPELIKQVDKTNDKIRKSKS